MEKEKKKKLWKYTAGTLCIAGVAFLGMALSSTRKKNKSLRREIDMVTGENQNLKYLNRGLQKQNNALAYQLGKIRGAKQFD